MLAQGLTTFAETVDRPGGSSRSDCHAWSAHPTFDLLRIVAGIRPVAPGFTRVRIAPSLGALTSLHAVHPSPLGDVTVDYRRAGTGLDATIELPDGMTGELVWRGMAHPLRSGRQEVGVR
jgi:hypothetical protein